MQMWGPRLARLRNLDGSRQGSSYNLASNGKLSNSCGVFRGDEANFGARSEIFFNVYRVSLCGRDRCRKKFF